MVFKVELKLQNSVSETRQNTVVMKDCSLFPGRRLGVMKVCSLFLGHGLLKLSNNIAAFFGEDIPLKLD